RGQRVGAHRRTDTRGRHTTDPAHMPKAHQRHLEWTPSRIIGWAQTIGPQTAALVEAILADRPHPEQGYRSCLGILRLAKRYGPARGAGGGPLLSPRRFHPQARPRSGPAVHGRADRAATRPRTCPWPAVLPVKEDVPMLTAPTLEKLQYLKLDAMAHAWGEQQHAEMTSLAFDERFGFLVDAEWLARENKRLARALKEAKLKFPHACVE